MKHWYNFLESYFCISENFRVWGFYFPKTYALFWTTGDLETSYLFLLNVKIKGLSSSFFFFFQALEDIVVLYSPERIQYNVVLMLSDTIYVTEKKFGNADGMWE